MSTKKKHYDHFKLRINSNVNLDDVQWMDGLTAFTNYAQRFFMYSSLISNLSFTFTHVFSLWKICFFFTFHIHIQKGTEVKVKKTISSFILRRYIFLTIYILLDDESPRMRGKLEICIGKNVIFMGKIYEPHVNNRIHGHIM